MTEKGKTQFFIKGLTDYSEETIITEIKRVAALIKDEYITIKEFNKYTKANASTIQRKFGGWQKALEASGLSHRYNGKPVTEKMKNQAGKGISNEEFLMEIRRIAEKLQKSSITHSDFNNNSIYSSATIAKRFGNWDIAIKEAGLKSHIRPPLSEQDMFENILNVWTHYGRQPTYKEMNIKPSIITGKTYENRFGTWRRALYAFEEFANSDQNDNNSNETESDLQKQVFPKSVVKVKVKAKPEDIHNIPLGLRYKVLQRDRFRCVKCGRSPAVELNIVLHVDHKLPFSLGGKTIMDNLQTTCQECNLGKGNRDNE